MKIKFTKHSLERTIERVKKIQDNEEAKKYLSNKFTRFMKLYEKEEKFHWFTIFKWVWMSWNLFIGTKLHRIIYEQLRKDIYRIITYHIAEGLFIKKKNKVD